MFVLLYTQERGRTVIRAAGAPQFSTARPGRAALSCGHRSAAGSWYANPGTPVQRHAATAASKLRGAPLSTDAAQRSQLRLTAPISSKVVEGFSPRRVIPGSGSRTGTPRGHALKRMTTFHLRRAPAAQQSLQNSACPGPHRNAVPFSLGPSFNRRTAVLQTADAGA